MVRPKLIVLRGLTGSGKSTIAKILLERYPWICEVCIDKIREENATESYCFPEAGRRAKEVLSKGNTVLVHDAFDNRTHMEMFLEPTSLSLTDDIVYVFRLECTKDEAYERNRNKPDHKVEEWQTEQQYRKNMEELPGEVIISTSNKSESQVAEEVARGVGLVG